MLEQALSAGLCSVGADISLRPLYTWYCLPYKGLRVNCGVVLSASHNPFYDNGEKIFLHQAMLSNAEEEELKGFCTRGERAT